MAQALDGTCDPWADSVYSSSVTGVSNPNNAVGSPDGRYTNTIGIQSFITLDMGAGEEGTGSLRAYFGPHVHSDIQVDFLDSSLAVIKSDTQSLTVATSSNTVVFDYNYATYGKAYRYVRLISTLDAGFTLDAVEALSYACQGTTSPPATCQSDTWTCTDWSSCSAGGQETRSCTMTFDCPTAATPSPATSQACTPSSAPVYSGCQSDVWSCSDWSGCSSNGTATRGCTMVYDCPNVVTPSPALSESCTPSASSAPTTNTTRPKTNTSGATIDNTPPVISGITATSLDPMTEKITWITDQPSDSQV